MKMKIKKMVFAALFAALTCVATMIKIPVGVGYVNMGDSIVLLGGFLLGPVFGALSGGIGSCISDIINGYAEYAVPTFVIKALVAFCAGGLYHLCFKKMNSVFLIVCGIVGEIIMVLGYFLFETFVYSAEAAAVGILPNSGQALFGILTSVLIFLVLKKNPKVKEYINFDKK